MLQGDLVFFYYSCRLDLYMSLLGSSLLSRFSGIVICERFFYFMFYLFFVCVFVLIFELRQGFSVALDPVFGTSLRLASKLSQRSTSLFQIWNPSLWMFSSYWVQKPPHKQFPETTWWESSALFCWQGLEMPIYCTLVGAGKDYLLAEVEKLLNLVIFRFLRKKQSKTKPKAPSLFYFTF